MLKGGRKKSVPRLAGRISIALYENIAEATEMLIVWRTAYSYPFEPDYAYSIVSISVSNKGSV